MGRQFILGERSKGRLSGVQAPLRRVVERAIELTVADFTVIEGLRTLERQQALYAQGRTAPGKVVTWTMNSRHLEGAAVDLAPVDATGRILWEDIAAFDQIAEAMFAAADELGVSIRWGADWDQDGNPRERGEGDSPHFELTYDAAEQA